MPSTNDTEREADESTGRLVAGLAGALGMWVLAAVAVSVYLTSWSADFDDPGSVTGDVIGPLALVVAVVLFSSSGPLAYLVSRRRWTVTLPIGAAVVWGLGVAVAFAT